MTAVTIHILLPEEAVGAGILSKRNTWVKIVIGCWKNRRTTRFCSSTRGEIVRCRFQKLYEGGCSRTCWSHTKFPT